jgi:hypothetical protein
VRRSRRWRPGTVAGASRRLPPWRVGLGRSAMEPGRRWWRRGVAGP